MAEDRFVGIELGGTKAIAVLASGDAIVDRLTVPTTEPVATLSPLLARIADWARAEPLAGLGIASFGPVRLDPGASDFGAITTTPKPGWSGAPILSLVADRTDCPIAIDTDVNGAALAEYRWGGGGGCSSLIYLTIGTGVGAGILIDGQPVHGRLHPEAGHLVLRRAPGDGFGGACGFHGDCIEGLLSGPALARRFGCDPAGVPPGDPRWRPVAHDLAQLLAALVATLAPQRILVGGGVGLGAPHLLPQAIALVPSVLGGYFPDLDAVALAAMIGPPALGADAGPLGAIALAQRAARLAPPTGSR